MRIAIDVFIAAEKYQIKSLKTSVSESILRSLSIVETTDILNILEMAESINDEKLVSEIINECLNRSQSENTSPHENLHPSIDPSAVWEILEKNPSLGKEFLRTAMGRVADLSSAVCYFSKLQYSETEHEAVQHARATLSGYLGRQECSDCFQGATGIDAATGRFYCKSGALGCIALGRARDGST